MTTGLLKEHISFSELKQWKECSWRHKLLYIEKLSEFEESPHLHYGTVIHDACEHFLKTKELKIDETKNKLIETWEKYGFDSEDFIILQTNKAMLQGWKYKHNYINDWLQWAETCISALPDFMQENFPNWELVSAEEPLYENIENRETKFKGFIDCIIKVPNKNEFKYWIIDWKTASSRGWNREKQSDFSTQSQVVLYKDYWAKKNNINLKNVMCCFILLKKVKKIDKACQIIKVSSGPKTIEKSRKMINNMLSSVEKNIFIKNRNNCKFCEFYQTSNCK